MDVKSRKSRCEEKCRGTRLGCAAVDHKTDTHTGYNHEWRVTPKRQKAAVEHSRYTILLDLLIVAGAVQPCVCRT